MCNLYYIYIFFIYYNVYFNQVNLFSTLVNFNPYRSSRSRSPQGHLASGICSKAQWVCIYFFFILFIHGNWLIRRCFSVRPCCHSKINAIYKEYRIFKAEVQSVHKTIRHISAVLFICFRNVVMCFILDLVSSRWDQEHLFCTTF